MSKINLNDIGTSFQSRQALNENFRLIEEAIDNTVSRDGSTPNHMEADLDLNAKDILNAGVVYTDGLMYRGIDITEGLDYFVDNGEELLSSLPTILDARATVLTSETNVLRAEDEIEAMEDNVIFLDANVLVNRISAQDSANIAVDVQNELQNAFGEVQAISSGILEAQAQANAVLGLGLGNAVVDSNGDLILTVYDGYFDNVTIDGDGNLILEWVVN